MMFVSLTLLFATSCGKDKDKEPDKPVQITLAVSGGTDVTLMGTDIPKDVTVTASAAAVSDIIVSLSSNAAEGEASFATPTITIKKGEKSAVGQITFVAAKFPKGTDAKKITVSISTTTDNVKVDVSTTDFSVKGEGGIELPTLTITSNGEAFNTTAALATITATFTLSAPIDEELAVTLALGAETTDDIRTSIGALPVLKIAAGQTTGTYTHDIAKGVAGKLVLNFTIENDKVKLNTTTLSATFTVDKPVLEPLCAIDLKELNKEYFYVAGFKIGETAVNITAEDPAYINKLGETVANITDGGEVKVFAVGNGDPVYAHVWVDWNKDNQVTENEMVGTTDGQKNVPGKGAPVDEDFLVFNFKAPENTPAGQYSMRIGMNYRAGKSGCDNTDDTDESRTAYDLTINYTPGTVEPGEDPTFSLVKVTTGDIVVPATGDKTATFKVQLSAPSDEAQTIAFAVTTDTEGKSGTLSAASVVIPANATTSDDVTITFASSAFPNETATAVVSVTATSETLEATTGSIAYNVAGTAASIPPVEQQALNCYLESITLNNKAACTFLPDETSRTLTFSVQADKANQKGDITFDVTVTGGSAGDYSFEGVTNGKVVMAEPAIPATEKGQVDFKVIVNQSAIGKNLSVNIISEGATIQEKYKSRPISPVRLTAPSTPLNYNVNYVETESGSKSATISKYGYTYVSISTENEEIPSQPLLLIPVFEGDFTVPGLPKQVILTEGYAEISFLIPFPSTTNGQTGTLKFTSPGYTTINTTPITFTIQK